MDDATFHTSRTYAHDPSAVYRAFEDPQALATWWGPAGFRNTFSAFDFREGGEWRFTMHAPGGADHPNVNRFVRLVPRERVVIRHESPPHFTLEVVLVPIQEGTALAWTQAFDDVTVARAVAPIVVPANEQNLDRLGAWLDAHPRG